MPELLVDPLDHLVGERPAELVGVHVRLARGVAHEVGEQPREPFGVVQVRIVSGALEQLQPAPGDPLLGFGRVPGWNHLVPRAPDDQGGDLDGHQHLTIGVHRLSARIDDRASGGEKGMSTVGVGQGREPVPRLGGVGTRPPAHSGEDSPHGLGPLTHPT